MIDTRFLSALHASSILSTSIPHTHAPNALPHRVRAALSPGFKDANAIMGAAAAAESSMSEAHAMHGVWGHKHTASRNRYLESAKHIGRKMKSSWRHPWTGSNAMLSSASALGLPAKYLCLAVQHL